MKLTAAALTLLLGFGLSPRLACDSQPQAAPLPPPAPTNVTFTTNNAEGFIRWTNPSSGGGPLSYNLITLLDITNPLQWLLFGRSARCYAPCTSYTAAGLVDGHTYAIAIQAIGPGGTSAIAGAPNVVKPDQSACTSAGAEACFVVDTTKSLGPITHAGSGLLHGTSSPDQWVKKVQPKWWRIRTGSSIYPNYASAQRAKAYGTKTIEVLSDDWYIEKHDPVTGLTPAPWLNGWADWDAFVTRKVKRSIADGYAPTYWQVWNEPGGMLPFLGTASTIGFTPQLQLELYKHTWTDIHAVDPSAKVTYMATVGLHDHADEFDGTIETGAQGQVALDQFLAYLKDNALTVDLLTWHETGGLQWLNIDGFPSWVVQRDVAAARQMLDAAGMGSVPIAIDEYTTPTDHGRPASTLSYLQGLEAAGVPGMRACWNEPDPTGLTSLLIDGCGDTALDNLLITLIGTTTPQPTPLLWVYDAYRQMSGNRVQVTTSTDWVSALASSTGNQVRLLLGRQWTCIEALTCLLGVPPKPATERVTFKIPDGTYTVEATSIPRATTLEAPIAKTDVPATVTASGGQATLMIPSVANDEVVSLVLTKTG